MPHPSSRESLAAESRRNGGPQLGFDRRPGVLPVGPRRQTTSIGRLFQSSNNRTSNILLFAERDSVTVAPDEHLDRQESRCEHDSCSPATPAALRAGSWSMATDGSLARPSSRHGRSARAHRKDKLTVAFSRHGNTDDRRWNSAAKSPASLSGLPERKRRTPRHWNRYSGSST